MIITTSGRPDKICFENAERAQSVLGGSIILRKKRSVKQLIDIYNEPVLVSGTDRFEYYSSDSTTPFFFHPNSSAFRIKRMRKGMPDPLIEASGLKNGDTFLDCTAGLCSDAITAACLTQNKVTALEINPITAFIISEGLKQWETEDTDLKKAMSNVEIINTHYADYLKSCMDNEFDIIYFDPMFTEEVQSEGISGLRHLADEHDERLGEAVREAQRVARKCIVLKDHFRSERFHLYGFTQLKRPSTKQHYGVIRVDRNMT
ncbi:class I SAM-dependent methyltransferase [Jeotgalibacillus aurantiacus]|uniref:class I SAM-dependent methyltransferase n=1 Tax=Jeotgalibacillus aurantiacus TaxID=2763266 RepID=UPI001D0B9B7A|nr:class I SAM-dependent methyltransferase [Jeotgalibacillus aurantiacus]